jgi:hypothetical protein
LILGVVYLSAFQTSTSESCDEPEAKKAKTEDQNAINTVALETEPDEPLWSPRYVNIAERLPEKSYLYVPPNRTIFRGVELFYDRDSKTFTHEVGRHHTHSSSDSSESVDGSVDSVDLRFLGRDVMSEGDACPSDADSGDEEETPKRPSSCPPFHD